MLTKYGDSYPKWREWHADNVHPMSMVGRVLSDGTLGPLEIAWVTLARYDFLTGREYDQPYFVRNPTEAKPAEAK